MWGERSMRTEELLRCLGAIEEVAGSRWLHDQVKRLRDTDPRQAIGAKPPATAVHPLAAAWLKAREELIMYEITGRAAFSEGTLRTARLGKMLTATSTLAGFAAQKNRLLEHDLFREAAFEIAVAAGYLADGRAVEFGAPGLMVGSGKRVKVVCLVAGEGMEEVAGAISVPLERLLNRGGNYNGPAVAYVELGTVLQRAALSRSVEQEVEKLKSALAGRLYNAVIIAGQGGAAAVVLNPAPRFPLPEGFKIYSPEETSSIP